MNKQEKIADKVRKLLAKARNNPSAEEAASAAAMAQSLMDRYRIDEALLSADEEAEGPRLRDVTEAVLWRFKGRRMSYWIVELWRSTCRASDLYRWTGWIHGVRVLEASGPEEDLGMARELIAWLVGEVEHLIDVERKAGKSEKGRSWANSFRMGCADQIGRRLESEALKARERLEASADPKETSAAYQLAVEAGDREALLALDRAPKYEVALVETALAILGEQKTENEGWAKKKHTFSSSGSYGGTSWGGGYEQGSAAGKRANIRPGKALP